MSTEYRVVKRKPRTVPYLAAGVAVTIVRSPDYDTSIWPNVGTIIGRGHPGQWFVCPEGTNLMLRMNEADIKAVPYRHASAVMH